MDGTNMQIETGPGDGVATPTYENDVRLLAKQFPRRVNEASSPEVNKTEFARLNEIFDNLDAVKQLSSPDFSDRWYLWDLAAKGESKLVMDVNNGNPMCVITTKTLNSAGEEVWRNLTVVKERTETSGGIFTEFRIGLSFVQAEQHDMVAATNLSSNQRYYTEPGNYSISYVVSNNKASNGMVVVSINTGERNAFFEVNPLGPISTISNLDENTMLGLNKKGALELTVNGRDIVLPTVGQIVEEFSNRFHDIVKLNKISEN